ncbi:putative membrane protein C14C4.07 [Psilocybe cubensis]|uniref:MFS general substrate transporter n=2 Tax=Psilocybe cubensis TaxID=181762 RepID=A0A8H7Y2A1_PSICU|nr:putative membrane protein C14C4.07 [Psilocybe cubensis]KAH9481397.1 putative membrane protein C14C4.07 [Psilocybe cubensis]
MSRSQLPPLNTVAGDALIGPDASSFNSPSRTRHHPTPATAKRKNKQPAAVLPADDDDRVPSDESTPLLASAQKPKKKPFYRPRPLWLVPFAVTASLVRAMTLAPRVEVFTQLSCNKLHGDHHWNHTQVPAIFSPTVDPISPLLHQFHPSNNSSPLSVSVLLDPLDQDRQDSDDTENPSRLPSKRCLSDPAVIAGAARIQAIMTTTMGFLSALTTGWWGHFSERHGRTRVMAIATLGLFLTDLTFILVSTPSSPLARHGHNLLLIAPVIEGLLGGWSTLQCATSAYLSDCTSPGSRAQIFSRFQGVFYLGLAVGPSIGGFLIQHPLRIFAAEAGGDKTVTTVFWVSIMLSFANLLLVLFVFPESLGKKKMLEAIAEAEAAALAASKHTAVAVDPAQANDAGASSSDVPEPAKQEDGVIVGFLRPLAVFLPVMVLQPSPNGIGLRKKRDWSLTILALALFAFMLSTGLYQLKYMYAMQTYGWGAEQLGYYISFMGVGRAVWLLFALPFLIGFFKPKRKTAKKQPTAAATSSGAPTTTTKKPKPTRTQLGEEIRFDLRLTRCSLLVDILSHTLVSVLPGPAHMNLDGLMVGGISPEKSQALFVLASSMNGMGSGAVPAIQSLALCMLQVRAFNGGEGGDNVNENGSPSAGSGAGETPGSGTLFGALAVLQAVGQMILGPMLFGLIYSGTAASFPKAIFVVGACIVGFAGLMMLCVRNPVKGMKRRRRILMLGDDAEEAERGRSRVSKDLRGGAVRYSSCDS